MDSTRPNVLLVHGILMNSLEMRYLGRQLEKAGFKVHYIFYHSVLKSAAENAKLIHDKIARLKVDNLHIVAHSMGGIVIMHLLQQYDDIPDGRVVMLGSPVQGSWIAKNIQHWPVVSSFLTKGMPQALSGEEVPAWENGRDWGMIAGTRNYGLGMMTGGLPGPGDGTVMIEETRHPAQTEHIEFETSHTGMLFSSEIGTLCANFLKTGTFGKTKV